MVPTNPGQRLVSGDFTVAIRVWPCQNQFASFGQNQEQAANFYQRTESGIAGTDFARGPAIDSGYEVETCQAAKTSFDDPIKESVMMDRGCPMILIRGALLIIGLDRGKLSVVVHHPSGPC